jgi:hypothetical protein
MDKYNILALISNHTNSIIKYNISLSNISLIKKHVNDIIIIDSENEIIAEKLSNDLKDDNKIKQYLFIKNNYYYDFGKWIHALENIDYRKYDYILFLNDSIILTENINNFFYYIQNVMQNVNIYGYNDSTQLQYHYQSYCFLLNVSIINKFIDFFNSRKEFIYDLDSLVRNIELNLHNIDDNRDCFLKIGNDYNMSKNLFWENDILYQYLLSKKIIGIMKLKKIFDMQREYKITIHGHSIENFNYNFYKTYYDDLNDMSDEQLLDHFIEYGQYEGRRYNNSINTLLVNYYRDQLDSVKLLYFFDIPSDFDIFYYKKNNDDLRNLSNMETIFHYINFGYYEGRIYNKLNSKNLYFNSFYFSKLSNKYTYDEEDLNNLNIETYMILNYNKSNTSYISVLKDYLVRGKKEKLLCTKKDLENILLNFDINIYKLLNKNLDNLNNLDVIKHYIENNLENGKYNVPNDFNCSMYKSIYSDLSNKNDYELKLHYLQYGKKEGRKYKLPDDFNPIIYQKIYKDLINKSVEELINHYLYYGIKENRIYNSPDNFDIEVYKKLNSELSNLNDIEILNHYYEYGINNNFEYILPKDFNINIYKKIYTDLHNLSDNELIIHYLKFGSKEKRSYNMPDDFDPLMYKNLNKDLNNLNDEQLILHYLEYGINEKRIYKTFNNIANEKIISRSNSFENLSKNILPDDFDYEYYQELYDDLKNLNKDELKKHYLEYGIYENRYYKINDDFDPNIYKYIYKDLTNLSNDELKKHYLTIGIKKNRIYKLPEDFIPNTYKYIYNDLSNLNEEQLKDHYLSYGIHEGRTYKIPEDFNPDIYKKLNSDLINLNNDQLIKHFIDYGINEKRKYKL